MMHKDKSIQTFKCKYSHLLLNSNSGVHRPISDECSMLPNSLQHKSKKADGRHFEKKG